MAIDQDSLKTFGEIAGIGGLAIGAFFYFARDIIAKNIFPTLTKEHSYRVITLLITLFFIVALAGLGSWTYVESKKMDMASSLETRGQATNPEPLPGGSGWIFAGYYNIERGTFIEGPWVTVLDTNVRGMRHFIEIGDTIGLKVKRDIYIVDFKKTGLAKQLTSPIDKEEGIVDNDVDKTGITLPAKTELIVKEVSEGHFPENPNAALWLRVGYVPK